MPGQVWSVNQAGGYAYSGELTDVLRTAVQPQTRFVQHCDADDFTDKGLHAGDAFQWTVYSDTKKQGGRLVENRKMPETGFTITRGDGTVYEFGNSVPYSGVLDDLSYHPIKVIINKVMRNDAVKAFEKEAHAEFAKTPIKVGPATGTSTTAIAVSTNGIAPVTNNAPMTKEHLKKIVDLMKEDDTPAYADGDYRCIGRPSTFRQLKDDLEPLHSYTAEGFRQIIAGEIGRSYEGVRMFEQTAIASQGWVNGKSDQAFFFGEDTVIEAIVIPPEIRGKLPGDYGRDKGVAWYAIEGFALVHGNPEQARIYEWASQG